MEQTVNADYNFSIETVGDSYNVTYSKDRFGKGLGCVVFFMALILSYASLFALLSRSTLNGMKPMTMFVILLIMAIGATVLIFQLIKRVRKDKTFTIAKDHIGVGDNNYAIKDIQKLYIKDPKGGVHRTLDTSGGLIIGGKGFGAVAVGMTSVASSGAKATAEIMNQAIHKASFKIEFLYGNRKVPLATGLSENNAIVLFDKVMALLNQKS